MRWQWHFGVLIAGVFGLLFGHALDPAPTPALSCHAQAGLASEVAPSARISPGPGAEPHAPDLNFPNFKVCLLALTSPFSIRVSSSCFPFCWWATPLCCFHPEYRPPDPPNHAQTHSHYPRTHPITTHHMRLGPLLPSALPSPQLVSFSRQKACHSPPAPEHAQHKPLENNRITTHHLRTTMAIDGTSGRATQRKRKRPLPASDSSKSTTTNSAPQRGGTCPKSASLSSSATTNSISGNKKRTRSDATGNGASAEGDEMAAEDLDVEEEDGGRGPAAGLEGSLASTAGGRVGAGQNLTRAAGKPRARSEMVRQVEKLVSSMFKELDVLLRAEDINRRVMVRPDL